MGKNALLVFLGLCSINFMGCESPLGHGDQQKGATNSKGLLGGDCNDTNVETELCAPGLECFGGKCLPPGSCLDDSDCAGDEICRLADNTCVAIDCLPENVCRSAEALNHECNRGDVPDCCLVDADCPAADRCDVNNTCSPVDCMPVDVCHPAVVNAQRVCERTVVENCCLVDGDCAATDICSPDNQCEAIVCVPDPANACDQVEIIDRECIHSDNQACCQTDADCADNEACNGVNNQCEPVPCGQVNACDNPMVANHACGHSRNFGCCLFPGDDAACAGFTPNLPAGYIEGCPTDAVRGQANRCTTCSDRDNSGRCADQEVCGNNLNDNGRAGIDEVACVECIDDSDCAVGQTCSLRDHSCQPPAPPVPVDTDGDGVIDNLDICPLIADPAQTDSDVDGLGNVCDTCPNVANPGAAQTLDSDGDGTPDACDNCPATVNADQADADANGIGNACEPVAPPPPANLPLCAAMFPNSPCGAECDAGGGIVCLWTPTDFGQANGAGCAADLDSDGLSASAGDCNDRDPNVGWCWGGNAPPLCAGIFTPVAGNAL